MRFIRNLLIYLVVIFMMFMSGCVWLLGGFQTEPENRVPPRHVQERAFIEAYCKQNKTILLGLRGGGSGARETLKVSCEYIDRFFFTLRKEKIPELETFDASHVLPVSRVTIARQDSIALNERYNVKIPNAIRLTIAVRRGREAMFLNDCNDQFGYRTCSYRRPLPKTDIEYSLAFTADEKYRFGHDVKKGHYYLESAWPKLLLDTERFILSLRVEGAP